VLDFRPPKDSPALINFFKIAVPLYMKIQSGGLTVMPVEGALERFQKVSKKRGMVCPNHSNRIDPEVMFAFSIMVKEDFNYVAAREVFDWDGGFNGWLMQRVGAYSVVRGAADRESFKMTRKVLAEGKKKLVLFPEGEISRQNDTLMTLESGAAQLTFWGVEELIKMKGQNNGQLEPLYLIPVALKYTYAADVRPALRKTLSVLESRLGLTAEGSDFYPRLRAISAKLLSTMEQEYGLKSPPDATTNDRIKSLRTHILNSIAAQLHITLAPNAKPLECVRTLRNAMDDFVYVDESPKSEYHKKIHDEKAAIIKGFYRDLDRIVNFIVIYEGYFQEQNTQERFADIIERLESEIIGGDPSAKGARRVLLDVGEPINMSERFAEYKKEKKLVLNKVTDEVSQQISDMLINLDKVRSPLLLH
jgi:1-acyl-sn-glycerol-3-phosphate acyltransferase